MHILSTTRQRSTWFIVIPTHLICCIPSDSWGPVNIVVNDEDHPTLQSIAESRTRKEVAETVGVGVASVYRVLAQQKMTA